MCFSNKRALANIGMKILCPLCGVEGHLQVRGNSQRVVHYRSFVNGKIVYAGHRMEINGNQQMEINKSRKCIFNQNEGGRSLAWSGHRLPKPATRVQIPVAAPSTERFCTVCIWLASGGFLAY